MQSELHLKLLGCPQIIRDGIPVSGFISTKVPALFFYLAVTGRLHSRDVLGALFWGEVAQHQARKNLRDALSNLRKLLDPYIVVTGSEIGFNRQAPYRLDVEEFETGLQAALCEKDLVALNKLIDLYRGHFLEGFYVKRAADFEDWAAKHREHLQCMAGQALQNLVELNMIRSDTLAALNCNNKWLTLEPWNEEAHQSKITLLLKNGQRSAALIQYAACQRVLMEELGTEPELLTQTLITRFDSATRPIPHNKIRTNNYFVGREAELKRIDQLLADNTCHLITVLGSGGIGKTALIQKAAANCIDRHGAGFESFAFSDGIFFVSLANIEIDEKSGPSLPLPTVSDSIVTVAIAYAIGEVIHYAYNMNLYESPVRQLINYLAGKQMLLILDNFEHLVPYCEFLNEILNEAPGVKLLVSSRISLNLIDEWVLELGGLSIPASTGEDSVTQSSAYNLFLYHARRIMPDFTPAGPDQTAIIKLCQLVQGLPLALELAASWLRSLSLAEIIAGIESSFDFLTAPYTNIPERHRSLRLVFEHSWRLLSPEEQTAFRKLGIFSGGISREAAQIVAGAGSQLLAKLVNKSLLHYTLAGRYEVHAIVHQYALEKLRTLSQQFQVTSDLHCGYFATLVARTALRLKGADQKKALDEIYENLKNIRKAWNWAVAGFQEQHLEQLLEGICNFYSRRNYFEEGQSVLTSALAALQLKPATSPRLTGCILAWLGLFYLRLGLFDQSKLVLERAVELLRIRSVDKIELVLALDRLGRLYMMTGKYDDSQVTLLESLALSQTLEDPYSTATVLYSYGRLAEKRGQYSAARTYMEQSLAMRRTIKDYQGIALSLNFLGSILATQLQYAQASQLHRESFELFELLGDQWGAALSLTKLGDAAFEQGSYNEAQSYFVQALKINYNLGVLPKILSQLLRIATVYLSCQMARPALGIFAFLASQPFLESEDKIQLNQVEIDLKAQLPQTEIEAVTKYRHSSELKEIIELILSDNSSSYQVQTASS